MAEYYLNAQGSETYPFDTAEKGVTDLTRLYHYLDNSNSSVINVDFTDVSPIIQTNPDHIAPFPKGAEKVIFKTTVQEHEIMPIYIGEINGYSNYTLPSGCILGTQNISLGVWSFKTTTTWADNMGRVTYNRFIRKGTDDIKAFPDPSELQILDRVMDYYWVVDEYFVDMYVVPEGEELDLEVEPMWHNNHGQNTWQTFFNNSYQKYESSLVGSIADGRTHIYSMSNWSLNIPAVALTSNDKIYVVGDIEEQAGIRYPDYLERNNSFKDALLTSNDENIKSKFTIKDGSRYYNNLSIDNLDLYTANYPFITNPKRISNCSFNDFSWCGVYFDDLLPNTSGEVAAEIYGNTFNNSLLYDSEGHYDLSIHNNTFTNEGMIYLDDSLGKHKVYNNVFTNNSYIDLENRFEQSMADCVICNNTFSNLEAGYNAIYIVWRDNYGATMSLKLFNNIVDSGSIYISLTAANPANILNFLHSNNCCPTYDYTLNGAAVAPNENEISEAPLFDVENLSSPLMLLESSPCYGTGILDPETPALDFLGAKRKTEPGPDMGAFETVASETPTSPRWGKASDYLIQQYKDGKSLPAVVDLNNDRLMALADIVQNIPLVSLGISMAEGVQLDNIGRTVDAGRGSLTDVQYRDWILYIQGINASGGGPDVILGYIRKVLGDSIADILFDEGNAAVNIQLTTQGVVPASTIDALVLELGRIVPAGVEVRLLHSEDGYVFAVADEGGETTLGYGFSEEDNEPPTGRTTGGRFIDPIRVGG